MRFFSLRPLFLAWLLWCPALVQADTDPPAANDTVDPQAVAILMQAADFLAAQQQLSVDWFVSFDQVIEGREKITLTRSGRNILDRGQGCYAYTELGEDSREYYFDGAAIQIVDVERNSYVMAPFTQGFAQLADRLAREYDVRLPLWQLMSDTPRESLLDEATAGAYLGQTRLAGRAAHHLAFSEHERDWQLWVAADEDRPEILMLVGTDPYTQGWPQFRAYFTHWDFAPDIAEGLFTYVPDETAERMAWPRPVASATSGEAGQ